VLIRDPALKLANRDEGTKRSAGLVFRHATSAVPFAV
jgi:hypothetical protein